MNAANPLFRSSNEFQSFLTKLKTQTVGKVFLWTPSTESTNDLAAEDVSVLLNESKSGFSNIPAIHDNAPQMRPFGLVVAADEQTAGRGRRNRAWQTPKGKALTFSVGFPDDFIPPTERGLAALASGLAVAEALEKETRLPLSIKWPNDIVLADENGSTWTKLGGVLCEHIKGRLVIGIGININQSKEELPESAKHAVTSLNLESGKHYDRKNVLSAVLYSLENRLGDAADPQSRRQLQQDIESKLRGQWDGKIITLATPDQKQFGGRFIGLNKHGHLILENDSGQAVVVVDAEILSIS